MAKASKDPKQSRGQSDALSPFRLILLSRLEYRDSNWYFGASNIGERG